MHEVQYSNHPVIESQILLKLVLPGEALLLFCVPKMLSQTADSYLFPVVKKFWCWADLFSFVGRKCWAQQVFTHNNPKLLALVLLFLFCWPCFFSIVGHIFSLPLVQLFSHLWATGAPTPAVLKCCE